MTMNVRLSTLKFGGDIDSRSGVNRGVSIDSLANSIAHLGLILPLSVIADGEFYRVVDGNRRLAALQIVHEGDDVDVPVLVQTADLATAREMSLAANIERLPLHPVDQYEAFVAIEAEGKTVADIASAFGISDRTVKQRLALGSLIPEVRAAYRDEELDTNAIRAMANLSTADQQKLWDKGHRGWQLRNAAMIGSESAIRPNSSIAKFVTLERYLAEGGEMVKDLFVEEGEQLWSNPALVKTLADKMLGEQAQMYVDAGWQFCEREEHYVYSEYTIHDGAGDFDLSGLTDEDKARWMAAGIAVENQDPEASFDQDVQDAIDFMDECDVVRLYTAEQKSRLGVVIDSQFNVLLGAERKESGKSKTSAQAEGDEAPAKDEPDYSNSMAAELHGHLTHAVQGCISSNPATAKKVLLAHLISQEAMQYGGFLSMRYEHFKDHAQLPYDSGLAEKNKTIKSCGYAKAKTLPARLKALDGLSDATLDQLLAYYVAQSVVFCTEASSLVKLFHSTKELKPLDHWTPTVENFFGRLTKKQLAKIAADEKVNIDLAAKRDAIAKAVRDGLPADWLPKMMRA